MHSFDIVTLTVNPALDKSASFTGLMPEKKIRCSEPQFDAGGGGINVSKAIHRLGGTSLCVYTSGGSTGEMLEEKVTAEGLESEVISVNGLTRESFVALETNTNAQYRFGFPGEPLSEEELEMILETIREKTARFLVVSGSLSEGMTPDFLLQVADIAKENNSRFILDTSGEALEKVLEKGSVYLVKPNIGELASLIGVENLDTDDADEAAKKLIDEGKAEIVVVSLGPQGAVLVSKEETIFVPAPHVKKQSTVGAGDSMVGGMTWALSRGKSLKEVAKWGVACGSAATMNTGTQLFKKEDAEKLYKWLENK